MKPRTEFKIKSMKKNKKAGGVSVDTSHKCVEHPRYKGEKPPKSLCIGCWEIFSFPANANKTMDVIAYALENEK